MEFTDYDRFARFYDADLIGTTEDIPFYLGFADRTGDPILELAAGTGRVLMPLALAGHRIVGVDISRGMLALAQAKIADQKLGDTAQVLLEDMRTMRLPQAGTFALAFCALNSFMHMVTQEDQLAALRTVHNHLRPGGLLIIDQYNITVPDLLEQDGRVILYKQWSDPFAGSVVFKYVSREINMAEQVQDVMFIYDETFPDGRTARTLGPFQARWLWKNEGELLLQKVGFEIENIYGSYDLDLYGEGADKLIFVARKKGSE